MFTDVIQPRHMLSPHHHQEETSCHLHLQNAGHHSQALRPPSIHGSGNLERPGPGVDLSRCSSETKEKAFTTLVRPVLEYAGVVWDPWQANHISQLESIQRKAARSVHAVYRRSSSVTRMMDNLGQRTLGVLSAGWTYSTVQPINKLLASYQRTLQWHNQEPGPATTSNTSLPKLTPMSTSSVSFLDEFEHGTSYRWPLSKRTLWTHSRQLSITPSELETCIWFPQEIPSSDGGWAVPAALFYWGPCTSLQIQLHCT